MQGVIHEAVWHIHTRTRLARKKGSDIVMADYTVLITRHRPLHNGDTFSRQHPKMRRGNRAKIFAPFDPLSGFDEKHECETVFTVHPC